MNATTDLSPENLSTLYDESYSPTLLLSEDFTIEYFNPLWATLLQLPPRKIKDQKVSELLPIKQEMWSELYKDAKEKGSSVSPEVDFVYQGQNFSFVFRLVKVSDKKFLLFGNDLSVEKTLHSKYRDQVELLKESHQEVVQADKVKAIGELTAGISHEINNPLTVASGNAEILGFSLESENLEEQREAITSCVENINESLDRISEIIKGMKGFLHKGQQEKKQYLDLKDVVDNSLKLIGPTFEEWKVSLEVALPENHLVALGNKTRLEQILINLLQNALDSVKAKGEDGVVKLTMRKSQDNHAIYIDVLDNGPGVSQDNQEKIFDTFFTTKAMGEGTGLGLSICRKIAEDHQGGLFYMPDTKEGAHFRLSLPVIEVSSYTSNDEILSKMNDVAGKKVLVVDNDATILNLCQKFLEGTHYIFIGSTGGEEALAVLEKYHVDVVITDLHMPGLDGRGFVQKLREGHDELPVYYLSGEGQMEAYQKDKGEFNLSGMLVKPFKSEELLSLLNKTFTQDSESE